MNKSDKKRLRRELEDRLAKEAELNRIRKLNEDLYIRGIGFLTLQIMKIPSFDKGICWDFRQQEKDIKLYCAHIDSQQQIIEPGYYEATLTSEEISKILEQFNKLTFSIKCGAPNMGIADGTQYLISLAGRSQNKATLTWVEEGPPEWSTISSAVQYTLTKLEQVTIVKI